MQKRCKCSCRSKYYNDDAWYCCSCDDTVCFPSTAKVNLGNGKTVEMSQLEKGDHIQTGLYLMTRILKSESTKLIFHFLLLHSQTREKMNLREAANVTVEKRVLMNGTVASAVTLCVFQVLPMSKYLGVKL